MNRINRKDIDWINEESVRVFQGSRYPRISHRNGYYVIDIMYPVDSIHPTAISKDYLGGLGASEAYRIVQSMIYIRVDIDGPRIRELEDKLDSVLMKYEG